MYLTDHLTEVTYSKVWCLEANLEVCFLLDNFILPNSLIMSSHLILQSKWRDSGHDMSNVCI